MQNKKSKINKICKIILAVIAAVVMLIGAAAGVTLLNCKPAQHSIEEYEKDFSLKSRLEYAATKINPEIRFSLSAAKPDAVSPPIECPAMYQLSISG